MEEQNTLNKPTWGRAALGAFADPSRAAFVRKVYGWMTLGLLISAAASLLVYSSQTLADLILGNMAVFIVLILLELAAVISLSAAVHKMSSALASGIFILYSVLNGLTLSSIFILYTTGSIIGVFVATAVTFAVLSIYGAVTKRDLTSAGHFAFMGLIGIIIAMLVNFFIGSGTLDFLISIVGVLVFTVLTAWDTQKLKWLYERGQSEGPNGEKQEAIIGALTLYLDFVNLFIDLLRLFGRRK